MAFRRYSPEHACHAHDYVQIMFAFALLLTRAQSDVAGGDMNLPHQACLRRAAGAVFDCRAELGQRGQLALPGLLLFKPVGQADAALLAAQLFSLLHIACAVVGGNAACLAGQQFGGLRGDEVLPGGFAFEVQRFQQQKFRVGQGDPQPIVDQQHEQLSQLRIIGVEFAANPGLHLRSLHLMQAAQLLKHRVVAVKLPHGDVQVGP